MFCLFIVTEEISIKALEVKWDKSSRSKSSYTLRKNYPDIETRVITRKEFE